MVNFCPNCGSELTVKSAYCPDCGASLNPQSGDDALVAVMVNKKSVGLTLIFSILISGLGHLYLGKIREGAVLLVVQIALAVALVLVFLFTESDTVALVLIGALAIVSLAIWVVAIWNSWKLVNEYNGYLLAHKGQPPW